MHISISIARRHRPEPVAGHAPGRRRLVRLNHGRRRDVDMASRHPSDKSVHPVSTVSLSRLNATNRDGADQRTGEAAHANQLSRALARWERLDLICVDELGTCRSPKRHAR
jgi:hypothetical protein